MNPPQQPGRRRCLADLPGAPAERLQDARTARPRGAAPGPQDATWVPPGGVTGILGGVRLQAPARAAPA